MTVLPILTFTHFSLKGGENVPFELGSERVTSSLFRFRLSRRKGIRSGFSTMGQQWVPLGWIHFLEPILDGCPIGAVLFKRMQTLRRCENYYYYYYYFFFIIFFLGGVEIGLVVFVRKWTRCAAWVPWMSPATCNTYRCYLCVNVCRLRTTLTCSTSFGCTRKKKQNLWSTCRWNRR